MSLSDFKEAVQATVSQYTYPASFLLALGGLSVLSVAYKTLVFLLQTFVLPGENLKRFGAGRGAWAVVTGATDGIGKEFALQLAKAGFNIFLVSRNAKTLEETGQEIAKKYNVSTSYHSIDFAKADEAAYNGFAAATKDLDVGVLVNNVGKSHSMPVDFVDTPLDEIKEIPKINVDGTIRVTYAILPGMIQRKRGLILNIGSFSGYVPSAMLAVYSGTKAFLATFSSALGPEVKKHNIVVEHVNTYFVVSKLSKIRKPNVMIPLPGPYVRSVLSKIGVPCGAAFEGLPNSSTPYWSHGALNFVMYLIGLPKAYIQYTHNLHKDIRRRALKKAEREAKKQ